MLTKYKNKTITIKCFMGERRFTRIVVEGFTDFFLKNSGCMVSKTAGKVYGKRGHWASNHKILSMEEVIFDAYFVDNFSIP
ncbi:hypothetical protein Q8G35_20420 [Peribacillus simplex]|uniref:Uncharacterized protein n=2 Tax=Peribacillus TaxID=2675229 RepID=A0AA90SXE7_9BACI|nr:MULTISPECIES: hypothetical protein [Peribacillus]MDP1420676.1 hypothetical protein [Peribacillus simplex]MDP1453150.1 hypothetical protein [Peribacillus frigoritolerans]